MFDQNRPGGAPVARRGGFGGPPSRAPHPSALRPQRGGLRRPVPATHRDIDRTKTCPFLLRVFPSVGKHHK